MKTLQEIDQALKNSYQALDSLLQLRRSTGGRANHTELTAIEHSIRDLQRIARKAEQLGQVQSELNSVQRSDLVDALDSLCGDMMLIEDIDPAGSRAVNFTTSAFNKFCTEFHHAMSAPRHLQVNGPGSLSRHIQALKDILIDSVIHREPDFIIGESTDPYLVRWWLRRDRPEGSIYLHQILKSDDDRALHDHPWPSTSIILQGTLREVLPDGCRLLTPGSITSRTSQQAHRLEVVDGPVWSLFITGAVEREWGFHCPNGWVHWKDFTDPGTNGQTIGRGCGE